MDEQRALEIAEDRLNRRRKLSRIRATYAQAMYNQKTGKNVWLVHFENGKTLQVIDK